MAQDNFAQILQLAQQANQNARTTQQQDAITALNVEKGIASGELSRDPRTQQRPSGAVGLIGAIASQILSGGRTNPMRGVSGVPGGGADPNKKVDPILGNAFLARAKERLSPEAFGPLEAAIKARGGLQSSELGSFDATFGDAFFKQKANPDGTMSIVDTSTGREISREGLPTNQIEGYVTMNPLELKVVERAQGKLADNPIIKESQTFLAGLDQARTLLNADNAAAPEIFRSFAARSLAQEKGVLTDRDVLRMAGSQALADRFTRMLHKWHDGKFDPDDIKDFNGLMDKIQTQFIQRSNQSIEAGVKQTYALLGGRISESQLKDVLSQTLDASLALTTTPQQSSSSSGTVNKSNAKPAVTKVNPKFLK